MVRLKINLCLLMPLNQLPQKQVIIDKLAGKSFKYIVNGQATIIKVNSLF